MCSRRKRTGKSKDARQKGSRSQAASCLEILKAIVEIRGLDSSLGADHDEIAEHLDRDPLEIQDTLHIMEGKGLVKLAKDRSGTSAWLEPAGRMALRDPKRLWQSFPEPSNWDLFHLKPNFHGIGLDLNQWIRRFRRPK